jgi:hypothetical protein
LRLQRLLISGGVLAATTYIGLDLLAASLYPGYSLRDQAISELSAKGAPTAALWGAVAPVFAVGLVAFGVGLWRMRESRALRLTGALILSLAALSPLWALFPMNQREAAKDASDIGHLVLAALSSVLIIAFMLAGATSRRGWFRALSFIMALTVAATFALTFAFVGRMSGSDATAWLGVIERTAIYGYLLWIALLATLLLPRESDRAGVRAPGRTRAVAHSDGRTTASNRHAQSAVP